MVDIRRFHIAIQGESLVHLTLRIEVRQFYLRPESKCRNLFVCIVIQQNVSNSFQSQFVSCHFVPTDIMEGLWPISDPVAACEINAGD